MHVYRFLKIDQKINDFNLFVWSGHSRTQHLFQNELNVQLKGFRWLNCIFYYLSLESSEILSTIVDALWQNTKQGEGMVEKQLKLIVEHPFRGNII